MFAAGLGILGLKGALCNVQDGRVLLRGQIHSVLLFTKVGGDKSRLRPCGVILQRDPEQETCIGRLSHQMV